MGTQQPLTTQQVELLIVIKEIEDYGKELAEEIEEEGGIGEILGSSEFTTPKELAKTSKALEYYGYLHGNYELTMDGRQYVELFQEYLQKKDKNPRIIHNLFTLINIKNLEVSLAKIDILGKSFKLFDIFKGKKIRQKSSRNFIFTLFSKSIAII